MRYHLSCKAESSIATVSSPNIQQNPTNSKQEKPFKIQQFHYSDLEAATNGFSEQRLLGKGSHGSVYKAFLRGRHVAVKKPSKGQEINQEADNEIEILSKIHSPRLVNLLGFATDTKDRILVVEFMSNGTLFDILHSNSRPPNWGRRIRLALQIAKAMETLHSQNPPIIHRDIKSANVLIDKNFDAKLGDFGLALRGGVDDYRLKSTPPAGTMGYLDPCYVTPNNLSTKTDVFSFGILLLEIISGRKAIDMSNSPPSVVDWAIPLVKRGKVGAIYDPRIAPLQDLFVVKQLVLIAAKCVRSCRERRPAMKDVVNWLTSLSKLAPLRSWNAFNNPCLMVETVGRPVQFRNTQLGLRAENDGGDNVDGAEGKFGFRDIKSSHRVFSDLGFRSNLMELMADTDGKSEIWGETDEVDNNSKSSRRVFSHRFGSRAHGYKGEIQSLDVFRNKRNQSVGGETELFSRGDDAISHSSIRVHLADNL